jgi:hypothetical protein
MKAGCNIPMLTIGSDDEQLSDNPFWARFAAGFAIHKMGGTIAHCSR